MDNRGLKAVAQPRILDIFPLRGDAKLLHGTAQASPQVPGTGTPALWADNSVAALRCPFEAPVNNSFQKARAGSVAH